MIIIFQLPIVEKIAEKVIEKPDTPISLLICLMVIAILLYLLIKKDKQLDGISSQLEKVNTLMDTILQFTKLDHEATKTNRDLIQKLDVCLSSNSVTLNSVIIQIGNLFNELHSHRDECNRKLLGK